MFILYIISNDTFDCYIDFDKYNFIYSMFSIYKELYLNIVAFVKKNLILHITFYQVFLFVFYSSSFIVKRKRFPRG
jgi:hypothetical protein